MPYRCNTGVGRKSGKGAPTASSKLQLCRNYRAERIAGEECAMRLLREGVRLEVPGHLFIVYAPVLLLLLRDDNISRTNRSRSARHLFLSSLSIHLSQLFFLSFLLSSTPLYFVPRFVASLRLSLPFSSRFEVGFIRSPYSPDFSPASWLVPRQGEGDCRHPMPWEIPFSTEFRGYSSFHLAFYLLVVFRRFCTVFVLFSSFFINRFSLTRCVLIFHITFNQWSCRLIISMNFVNFVKTYYKYNS